MVAANPMMPQHPQPLPQAGGLSTSVQGPLTSAPVMSGSLDGNLSFPAASGTQPGAQPQTNNPTGFMGQQSSMGQGQPV